MKSARNRREVSSTRLALLNSGRCETNTLIEATAMDIGVLVRNSFPRLNAQDTASLSDPHSLGLTKRMRIAGALCSHSYTRDELQSLATASSDTARGIVCFALAKSAEGLDRLLNAIKPLASDHHFAVKEWAWLAARDWISSDIVHAIESLESWATDEDENLRRFASEGTRPRGVWSKHIPALKQTPEIALPILTPLLDDESRYVQDSVGNWLNDAAKSQPKWVMDFVERAENAGRIVPHRLKRRALRSL